jgi:pSer/pThr/pTyr-binding forkhead associated (FHA) protein
MYVVEDLNSTNGTLLNSRELHGEAELSPGDVIRIGDTELRFEVS